MLPLQATTALQVTQVSRYGNHKQSKAGWAEVSSANKAKVNRQKTLYFNTTQTYT